MRVINLPSVALDSVSARIWTCCLLITSPAPNPLSTTKPHPRWPREKAWSQKVRESSLRLLYSCLCRRRERCGVVIPWMTVSPSMLVSFSPTSTLRTTSCGRPDLTRPALDLPSFRRFRILLLKFCWFSYWTKMFSVISLLWFDAVGLATGRAKILLVQPWKVLLR